MADKANRVCVIGLGYIGLPTASILATKGYDVIGVDVQRRVVDTINRGEIHIEEPGLDLLVKSAVNSGKLKATVEPEAADVFFISVPTPLTEDKAPDLSYVEDASRALTPFLKPGNLVILESTSPPGTTDDIVAPIVAESGLTLGEDLFVAHAPERVLPGHILREAVENDRIVGGIDPRSTQAAADFYATFVGGTIFSTDARTAELAKLTENAFRDVNIAFANELSLLCSQMEVNVWELIELANRHPRVNILRPGPGVGGHCIAVDPWFIVHRAPDVTPLMATARRVNDGKPHFVVERVRQRAQRLIDPVIVCLGAAYKADVDDLRESPALEIAHALNQANLGEVLVCEPFVRQLDGLENVAVQDALKRADIVVALVPHRQFKRIDPELLKEKILIDTCGLFNTPLEHRKF